MKRVLCGLSILGTILVVSSCGVGDIKDSIYINGNVEESIEVNTNFVDKGIVCPDGYTLIINGSVDATKLGKYQIVYSIYSSDGELVKELHRFVNVVDTTAPLYTEKEINDLYAGVAYSVSNFIEYDDNYDSVVNVTPSIISFSHSGQHTFSIELEDSSGNVTTYSKTVEVQFDFLKLIEEVYKDYPSKISRVESQGYTHVQISQGESIAYFSNTKSIHYLETVTTSLGTSASIQISAKYGEFNNASITFHISGSNSSTYSVASANVNATKYNSQFQNYRLFINNLNLNQNDVYEELNEKLPGVVSDFINYMNNVLKLNVE